MWVPNVGPGQAGAVDEAPSVLGWAFAVRARCWRGRGHVNLRRRVGRAAAERASSGPRQR
jgi:hypothetical protein